MKFRGAKWCCLAAAALGFLVLPICVRAEEEKTAVEKGKIAEVNGISISNEAYERELSFFLEQAAREGRQVPDTMLAKVKEDILDNLIDREVLYQKSQKEGIKIGAQAVTDQLATIKKRFPSDAEFKKALDQMKLSESDIKSQIEKDMAIRELIDKQVAQKVVITDAQTKSYYDENPNMFEQPEQVKASHILIKVETDASETDKAKARIEIVKIQKKLQNGEDFATLAKEFSQGPSSAKGGDLGFFRRGQMVKPFEDAAFALKPNEVSDVVETRFGYHLIKVTERKTAQTIAYADVKDRLSQHLKKQEVEKEAGQYIDKLRQEAEIEKYL